jgi:hypothetical protein
MTAARNGSTAVVRVMASRASDVVVGTSESPTRSEIADSQIDMEEGKHG